MTIKFYLLTDYRVHCFNVLDGKKLWGDYHPMLYPVCLHFS